MGAEKAFLPFRGKLLLDRAIQVLAVAASPVTIVGDPGKFSTYGLTVPDEFSGCGPLAGIHAGLKHSSSELNLFLAVDMPFVSEELLRFIRATAEQSEATVIVPRTTHGLQPLCAAYRRSFAPTAEACLKSGKYKIDSAFAGLSVRVIDESELLAHGFSERMFFNVNTPEDLQQAEQSGQLA
jgi:molybdopterin-guanine dinucleotide biosynthesis protein A